MDAKVLVFDIETAPDLGDIWNWWNTNISNNQIRRDGWIMSFAAKWLNDEEIIYVENRKQNDRGLVKELLKLIDEADVVIAHNGLKFDMGWFRSKAAIHGLQPPSPVKVIDTLKESRKLFHFPSYSLEYLLRRFNCTPKYPHKEFPGHLLWQQCLSGNDKAWEELKTYNVGDVLGLEEYYLKIRPWLPTHPNLSLYNLKEEATCPRCGSTNMKKDGTTKLIAGVYQTYRCRDCGGWARGRTNLVPALLKKGILSPAG